jgi:hypothetical protein
MSKKPRSKNPAWYGKGQTGNPGGRPRKSQVPQPSSFDVVMDKTVIVTREGIAREVELEDALQQRTYQDALAGNAMAQRQVLKWIMKHDAWNEKHAPKPSHPIATRRITLDPGGRTCRASQKSAGQVDLFIRRIWHTRPPDWRTI